MSITLGEFKNRVLHKIREFSNAGVIVSAADNADYFNSIPSLINDSLIEMQTTLKIMQKRYDIAHFMPQNQLGYREFNEGRGVLHDDEDVSFMATGSRAYSFQVSDTATIYIEENVSDTWVTLQTINHTGDPGQGYSSYKGKIPLMGSDNEIRIRFSGDYFYRMRWIALFRENFETDEKVPYFQPYVPYNMPDDFYQISKVVQTRPSETYIEYGTYRTDVFQIDKKEILFSWYEQGEFEIYYFNYPEIIENDAPDSTVIDIADELIPLLVNRVGELLQIDENTYIKEALRADYVTQYNALYASKINNQSFRQVHNVRGW